MPLTDCLQRCSTSILLLVVAAQSGLADGPADNDPLRVRQVPPPGIEITDRERVQLADGLSHLNDAIQRLRQRDDARANELLPDVEIFARAVDQALSFNGFFAPRDLESAWQLLEED